MISIIVPVYNAENYLHECIASLLSQTFKDYEVILVDDGSRDTSRAICDEYASKYTHIRVVHQENSGAYNARLAGIIRSAGEWITFVDADDCLPQDALDTLFSYASDQVNIVVGNTSEAGLLSVDAYRLFCMVGKQSAYSMWGKL